MSNTQSSVPSAGDLDIPHPWQTGPAELIAYAIEHMHRGSDFDRRIAFLLLDVGVETLFKVFLTLPAGVTGAKTPPHERSRASEGNFHELVAGVRGATGGRFDQSAAHYVQYYHGLRNKLYHQGDGVTVPIRQVEGYASLAVKLLNDLIEVDFALMLTHEPSGRGTTPSESRTEPDADRSSDPEKLLERQQELQRKFFADVRRKMRLLRPALRPRSRKAVTYNCSYGSSLHGALFGWDFVDSGNILRTRLSLATGDKAYNKALFDLLFAEKVQVETQIGAALLWDRRDDAVSAQIAIDVPFNLIEASASHVRYTQEWAVARLAAFVDTFNPLLESFSAPPTPNLVQSRTEKTSVELQRGKYGHLGEHLRQAEQDGDNRISLTFSDIEDLIGYDLPDSAREHRTWWANYYGNNQAKAWLEAGWLVDGVEMSQEEVNFRQSRVALYPVVFERLLRDLKSRGLLDETLVIWGGEFGRTPMSEKGDGRDHNPTGFTVWMAGGGVKAGTTVGSTDDLGLRAAEDKLHVHDLHATILYLMGIDHTRLVYTHKGRPERIDMNEGNPYTKIRA